MWGRHRYRIDERARDDAAPKPKASLSPFTELVASSIANAESRAELAQLVEEQAALRRVATLVAHGVSPTEVFAAVTEEVGKLLPVEYATLWQYEPDGWRRTLRRGARWQSRGSRVIESPSAETTS